MALARTRLFTMGKETMNELILALQMIQSKMNSPRSFPTHCHDDMLRVYAGVYKEDFTDEELAMLINWGFSWDEDEDGFVSGKFGSC
jgi:hypothetical protein